MSVGECVVCKRPGLLRAEGMCVHEHKLSEILCLGDLLIAAEGRSTCPKCYRADGSENVVRLLASVPA